MQKSTIRFHEIISSNLSERRRLKQFLISKAAAKRSISQLDFIFCSDEYLLDINRRFLEHDYFTDIITFDLSDKSELITAEIYISIDRVKENAQLLDTTYNQELHRVIFHGLLHLLGFTDKTKEDQAAMRREEDRWLEEYGGAVRRER